MDFEWKPSVELYLGVFHNVGSLWGSTTFIFDGLFAVDATLRLQSVVVRQLYLFLSMFTLTMPRKDSHSLHVHHISYFATSWGVCVQSVDNLD